MDNKELLKDGRILALKIIAESFLLSKGNKVTDRMFPKKIERDSNSLLAGDVLVLHHWLAEQYARLGLDLNAVIEATGEQVVPGKLSQFELNELIARADELLIMMKVIKEYVDAKDK